MLRLGDKNHFEREGEANRGLGTEILRPVKGACGQAQEGSQIRGGWKSPKISFYFRL